MPYLVAKEVAYLVAKEVESISRKVYCLWHDNSISGEELHRKGIAAS